MKPFFCDTSSNFYEQAKSYASTFNPCVVLDSCGIKSPNNKHCYKLVLGFGGNRIIEPDSDRLNTLYEFWHKEKKWIFGVLGYNLKNEIEKLQSLNNKCFNWPDLSFFAPETVLTISWDNEVQIYSENPDEIYNNIKEHNIIEKSLVPKIAQIPNVDFNRLNHAITVGKIKNEILNGNVYELNFCSRYLNENVEIINTFDFYQTLINISPSPFSAYYKIGQKVIMSASPERYLCKKSFKLISQPMKGTRPRGDSTETDIHLKEDLKNDLKDRAENVMIVDLVRNDLSRVSAPGSVKVEELFEIYSYAQVHQMVSTVSSQMENKYTWKDAIRASFPMGSMTGAPKIAAMKWIEKFEKSNREWYSGALGYINPEGDFDFNVLIRSAFYDSSVKILAYYAGGAITIDSIESKEFEEMEIKACSIKKVIQKFSE